jgi:RNA polymerase sigma factor (sigma-70 family)
VTAINTAEDIESLYASSYARLVSVVGAVFQDAHGAEEAVQDAFARLIGQWSKISRYEDPEAWVRKVAFGYMSNRRRKFLRGVRAARRHGPPDDVPPPTGDRLDLRRALAALPRQQREVVVLQGLGLTVEDIARQLDVAPGTVKSRLSRARSALMPLLREDTNDHV